MPWNFINDFKCSPQIRLHIVLLLIYNLLILTPSTFLSVFFSFLPFSFSFSSSLDDDDDDDDALECEPRLLGSDLTTGVTNATALVWLLLLEAGAG